MELQRSGTRNFLPANEILTFQFYFPQLRNKIPGQLDGLIERGDGVVGQDLQGDLLLGHGGAGRLVHLDVGDAHPAEYSEGLQEVLVI